MVSMNQAPQPVNYDELLNVVAGASSQDPRQVVASAEQLKPMLDRPGAFDGLSAIGAQRDLPLAIRQQAIIQFKNAALSHWRSKKLSSDDHRANIRARSLALLDEQDDIIADCNKIIVSKIARLEYPREWPTLMPDLVASINANLQTFMSGGGDARSRLMLRRVLDIVNAVIKELATVKMPAGIKVTGQLVEDLHLVLQSHYSTLTADFGTILTPQAISNAHVADAIRFAHLTYKCLAKLAVWLYHRLGLNTYRQLEPWMETFFASSAMQVKMLIDHRASLFSALNLGSGAAVAPSHVDTARSLDFLTRHIRQFGKVFRRLQQLSVHRFIQINSSSDLVLYYWSKVVEATTGPPELISDSPWAIFPVRFLVQAMVLFKESLAEWSPAKRGIESGAALSRDFVEEAVRLLVMRFIPLNPKDLESWMADPEEWVNMEDKESEQWEYELRPCGERVLLTLGNQYSEYVTPLLETTFKQVVAQPTTTLESIVQKEALYCAIGRCAQHLKDVIPFNDWLAHNLAAEVRDSNPSFPIIKRRIAWVIGRWISGQCASPNNDKIWETLIYLLSDRGPGTDAVVRYTAVAALRECLDTVGFELSVFLPHLPAAVAQLLQLTAEADTFETKRRVMKTLNIVIERAELQIVPYMEVISNSIPGLWTSSEDDWLFKASLLEAVTALITSTKEHSASLYPVVIPLLRESFSDTARLHLDEDGLRLWQAALRNAVTVDSVNGAPSLFDVLPIVLALFAENFDILGYILAVVKSYLVLDATRVLQVYAPDLFHAFLKACGQSLASVNVKEVIITLQALVQVAPSRLWAEPMHTSGLFAHLLKTLMDDKASTLLLTEQINLFSRMALADAQALNDLLNATAVSMNKPPAELWMSLLDQWWQRFDNMSEPRSRKLAAMGIANLVATGRPEVLERLTGEIFNLWLDVFGEIKEALAELSEDEANSISTLSPLITFWKGNDESLPDNLAEIEGTPEYKRWKTIYKNDPVETEKLTVFVAQRLQRAQEVCGGAHTFESQYLRDADPNALKQLREELSSMR